MSPADLLVYPGASLKMTAPGTGDGPLIMEGHLVVFSDETRPDKSAARDFFTSATDLGVLSDRGTYLAPTYYEHGQHSKIQQERIGTAELKIDDVGVFARHEITRRKDYLRKLAEEAEKEGVGLGQSSGAWPAGVERVAKANGTHWLAAWPIWEASILTTPAEPLTSASVKSLLFSARKVGEASLSERLERVHRHWHAMDGRGYVTDVFETYVVTEVGGEHFAVAYADDGLTVTFAPRASWTQVERSVTYDEVAKALAAFSQVVGAPRYADALAAFIP